MLSGRASWAVVVELTGPRGLRSVAWANSSLRHARGARSVPLPFILREGVLVGLVSASTSASASTATAASATSAATSTFTTTVAVAIAISVVLANLLTILIYMHNPLSWRCESLEKQR